MRPIRARFDSRCGLCGDVIEEGELIVSVDDEWCHVGCAEEAGEDVEAVDD